MSFLVAAGISLAASLVVLPPLITMLRRRKLGFAVRSEGPQAHLGKSGTPTMGGISIIVCTVLGYIGAHLALGTGPTASAILIIFLMAGLGIVGAIDDLIKLYMRRSLGLRSSMKLVLQCAIGVPFAIIGMHFANADGIIPISERLSFAQDIGPSIGPVFTVIWILLIVVYTSNAVNLTDGLDGLATCSVAFFAAAYIFIGIWEFNFACRREAVAGCYVTRDPLDVALLAAAILGACLGFLWWNGPPAKIFMGDTGSLALGGAMAGLAITTHTELIAAILAGLNAIITLSVVSQVGYYKLAHKRLFRMAPLQHHFELEGWAETTIVVRFMIIQAVFIGIGIALFISALSPSYY